MISIQGSFRIAHAIMRSRDDMERVITYLTTGPGEPWAALVHNAHAQVRIAYDLMCHQIANSVAAERNGHNFDEEAFIKACGAPTYGQKAVCARCDLDIEFVNVGWWDRGADTACPRGGRHYPVSS